LPIWKAIKDWPLLVEANDRHDNRVGLPRFDTGEEKTLLCAAEAGVTLTKKRPWSG
jgi:hypothetical protein